MRDGWMLMAHGVATVVYDHQGGERGNRETFSSNMLMLMAQRPLGPGTLSARTMLSMELAGTYSFTVTDQDTAFVYVGLPGEPALGPPTFMHRFSGIDNREAPITHHWLDSTHITYGDTTAGWVHDRMKLEGSIFTGREPDESRWDVDTPRFDSYAARLS
jgi:hypothetical protein